MRQSVTLSLRTLSDHQVRAAACFTSPIKAACSEDGTGVQPSAAAAQSLRMGVDAAETLRRSAKFSSSESVMWRRMDILRQAVLPTVHERLSDSETVLVDCYVHIHVISIIEECNHADDKVFPLSIPCIRLLFTMHHGIH